MDQPAPLLAFSCHAEKAISSGGNDPAVPGRLPRPEALLAVAAATGRLLGARSAIRCRLNHLGAGRPPQPGGTATVAGAGPQP